MTIQRLEEGRNMPRVDVVERLALALDISPCWLAYGVGPGGSPAERLVT